MVMVKLGYILKKKEWNEISKEFKGIEYNGKLIININRKLWEKIKNIIHLRKKGYDSLILIDGRRRTGKSTLAMQIAYILNPNITINNYVTGLEESPDKIDKAKDEDVLIFDEGSLVASSKDVMNKKNKDLEKIIDVCGQKKLTLIFCMPSVFNISQPIVTNHSLFLLHVYTDEKMNRGRFAYFGIKRKNRLYTIGKKNFGSYSKPKANFIGLFNDFHLPFEKDYFKLKRESLKEALNPNYNKPKPSTESEITTKLMFKFRENCPNIPVKMIQKGFGVSDSEYYRRKRIYENTSAP